MTLPTNQREFPPGSTLLGRYELERLVCESASGSAWLARDTTRHVIVKRFPAGFPAADRDEFSARLMRLRAKRIPGLPRLEDARALDEREYIVMEWQEGEPLDQLITVHRSLFPTEVARHLVHTLARALEELHALGLLHLDLTTANVLYDRAQGLLRPLDWGHAIAIEGRERPAAVGGLLDPVPYMSASLLAGEAPRPTDDAYSIVCIAYELITGAHPFGRRSALEARAHGLAPTRLIELSDAENELFARALDPRSEAAAVSLAEIATAFGPTQPPEPAPPRRSGGTRRSRYVYALAAAALVAIGVGSMWRAALGPSAPGLESAHDRAAAARNSREEVAAVAAAPAANPQPAAAPSSVDPGPAASKPAPSRPTLETALSDTPPRGEKRADDADGERLVPVVTTAVLVAAAPVAQPEPPPSPPPSAPPPSIAPPVPLLAPAAPAPRSGALSPVSAACRGCDCDSLRSKRDFTNEPLRTEELGYLRESCS